MKIQIKKPKEDLNQFRLLDGNVFDILEYHNDICIDSGVKDDCLYLTYLVSGLDSPTRSQNVGFNVVDITREHNISMLKQITRFGINTPRWYLSSVGIDAYYNRLDWDKQYMYKAFNQARSVGKKIVDIETLKNMYYDTDLETVEFNAKYNIDTTTTRSGAEEDIFKNSLRTNNYYLSEVIDVKHEYRVLWVETMTDVTDLVVKERHGCAPNSDVERTSELIAPGNINPGVPVKTNLAILKKLMRFASSLGKLTISMDLYVDKDGNYGLFEYSTEYGIEYDKETLKKLRGFYTNALTKRHELLLKHNNK